jgi:hypothetical protein
MVLVPGKTTLPDGTTYYIDGDNDWEESLSNTPDQEDPPGQDDEEENQGDDLSNSPPDDSVPVTVECSQASNIEGLIRQQTLILGLIALLGIAANLGPAIADLLIGAGLDLAGLGLSLGVDLLSMLGSDEDNDDSGDGDDPESPEQQQEGDDTSWNALFGATADTVDNTLDPATTSEPSADDPDAIEVTDETPFGEVPLDRPFLYNGVYKVIVNRTTLQRRSRRGREDRLSRAERTAVGRMIRKAIR